MEIIEVHTCQHKRIAHDQISIGYSVCIPYLIAHHINYYADLDVGFNCIYIYTHVSATAFNYKLRLVGYYIVSRPGMPPFPSILFSFTFLNRSPSSHLMVIMSHPSHNSFLIWYTQSHHLLSHHSYIKKRISHIHQEIGRNKNLPRKFGIIFLY